MKFLNWVTKDFSRIFIKCTSCPFARLPLNKLTGTSFVSWVTAIIFRPRNISNVPYFHSRLTETVFGILETTIFENFGHNSHDFAKYIFFKRIPQDLLVIAHGMQNHQERSKEIESEILLKLFIYFFLNDFQNSPILAHNFSRIAPAFLARPVRSRLVRAYPNSAPRMCYFSRPYIREKIEEWNKLIRGRPSSNPPSAPHVI